MLHRAFAPLITVLVLVTVAVLIAALTLSVRWADQHGREGDVLFEVGQAGTVTVRSDGRELRMVHVSAGPQWRHEVTQDRGQSIEVEFASSDVGIEFTATLDDAAVTGHIRIVSSGPVRAPEVVSLGSRAAVGVGYPLSPGPGFTVP